MSTCTRCGAEFGCAMRDGSPAPCWCTELPPAVPVPQEAVGCWCPACLRAHIENIGWSALPTARSTGA